MMNKAPEHDILWDYMDRVRWRLRRLPEQQSAEMLREIRQHMQDLVADNMAAGATPEEAVRKAEKKFGSAEKVADRLILGSGHAASFKLSLIILNSCYIVFSQHLTFAWGGIAFIAAIGAGYGALWAFDPTPQFRKYRNARQKWIDAFWIVAAVALLVVLVATSPWSTTEQILKAYAIGGATGVPTYFLVKGLHRRRDGAEP